MTRSEARIAAYIMLAYADGMNIESKDDDGEYHHSTSPSFDWLDDVESYRIIKPTPNNQAPVKKVQTSHITHVLDIKTQKVKRVLSFGKFKGFTIAEVSRYEKSIAKFGYLDWCLKEIEGFKEELTPEEYDIAKMDWHHHKYYSSSLRVRGDGEGIGAWLDSSDGALACGFASDADMF